LIKDHVLGQLYSFHLSCLWNRPNDYYTDWRGRTFPDGGTLYTQFSHYIDAILWLFGEVKDIKGFTANLAHKGVIDFEDTGAVSLQMDNQLLGTFHWSVNAYKKNHEIALTILAEKGTVRIGGEYLDEVQYQQMEKEFQFSKRKSTANSYEFYKGSMSNHAEVYQHLLQVLEKDDQSFTSAFDGLKTVETIERIYKAVSIKTS
jgi:predicted dehydrogenase